MTLFEYDNWIKQEFNCQLLCGIDEAGRGPLAGDVYAAAVILKDGVYIDGLNDSKKLTEKKRETLYDEIIEKAAAYSIATATVEEVETLNILNAAMLAMKRAFETLKDSNGMTITPNLALIDGNKIPDLNCPCRAVIKGDGLSASIAAASILAKVSRDRYMAEMALKYPQYQFEKHKGYGTKLHYEMIEKYGVCEIHRRTFLKKLGDL